MSSHLIELEVDEKLLRKTLLNCYGLHARAFHVSCEHYRYLAEQIVALREHIKRGAFDDNCTLPHLGLATTRELLDELTVRFEIHAAGGLDYRTVDGEEIAKNHNPETRVRGHQERSER